MTGFGQSLLNDGEFNVSVEIKSLNSKFFDLSLRLPKKFSEKELELRSLVADKLERGKVSLTIDLLQTEKIEISQTYNKTLFIAYYKELKMLADSVSASDNPIFQLALNSPNVIQNNANEGLDPLEWERTLKVVNDAIAKCEQFRVAEGRALLEKLSNYIDSLHNGLAEVENLDPKRVEKVRGKIKGSITDFFGNEGFDPNRLEQEIIFYIEKLDIHEERVRLRTHLDYFLNVLKDKQSNGKKLGFISQEIGREINTIGSKANDAEIQKHVVAMKEELEKIKEQLNNVL